MYNKNYRNPILPPEYEPWNVFNRGETVFFGVGVVINIGNGKNDGAVVILEDVLFFYFLREQLMPNRAFEKIPKSKSTKGFKNSNMTI